MDRIIPKTACAVRDDARHTIYRSNAVSRVEPADTSLDADQQPVES